MKYIPADKLIAEIERRLSELPDSCIGHRHAYQNMLSLITSLQQEQPIQVNTLTWKDINDLERIINNVHYEFRNGIGEKSFGEEVLERFREGRDEPGQPEVDLEKFTDKMNAWKARYNHPDNIPIKATMAFTARMFYQYPNVARQWYEQLPKAIMD